MRVGTASNPGGARTHNVPGKGRVFYRLNYGVEMPGLRVSAPGWRVGIKVDPPGIEPGCWLVVASRFG